MSAQWLCRPLVTLKRRGIQCSPLQELRMVVLLDLASPVSFELLVAFAAMYGQCCGGTVDLHGVGDARGQIYWRHTIDSSCQPYNSPSSGGISHIMSIDVTFLRDVEHGGQADQPLA